MKVALGRRGNVTVALVTAVIGYEWLHSGWDKITNESYVAGMPKTLAFFASKNPVSWYKDFLTGAPTSHPTLFAYLVSYGELFAGIALLATAVVALIGLGGLVGRIAPMVGFAGLAVGIFLSFNFFFAAGWSSPSTESVNWVMMMVQAVLAGTILAQHAMAHRRSTVKAPRVTQAMTPGAAA
jgi:uncharacterized membrane protein YphA (DoxX/SURF4 family)